MRRKLWLKAPAIEGALGHMPKYFQVYFIQINFFKKPNKKINNRAKELYCGSTIFFFDSLLSNCPKKMETEKLPKAADSPLFIAKYQFINKLVFCNKCERCENYSHLSIGQPVYPPTIFRKRKSEYIS